MSRITILASWITFGALACGRDGSSADAAKEHGGHVAKEDAPTKAATPPSAPVDPHAGHVMPEPEKELAADGNAYDIQLRIDPQPTGGGKSRMILDPRTQAGERVAALAIVHEKPLHFLLVSKDLSFFAHEHPEVQPDGTLALDYIFPAGGEYLAFADFTPNVGDPDLPKSRRL